MEKKVTKQNTARSQGIKSKRLVLVGMLLALLCALGTVAALPREAETVVFAPKESVSFTKAQGVSLLDMGVVAPLNDLVWLNQQSYAAISQDENSYLWVYACDSVQAAAEERAILSLEPGERYLSATALNDGTMVLMTTQRAFYLDKYLMEKRSVMLPHDVTENGLTEAVINETGNSAAFVTGDGLFLYNINTRETKALSPAGQYGNGSRPFMAQWTTASTLSFRYSAADSSMKLFKASVDTGEISEQAAVGLYAAVGGGYTCFVPESDSSLLTVVNEDDGHTAFYQFEGRVVSGLSLFKSTALVQTFDPDTGVTYFEKLRLSDGTVKSICSVDPQDGTTGRLLRISSGGTLAVELYTGVQSNTQILQIPLF